MCLTIVSCNTQVSKEHWSSSIPPRTVFVTAWLEQSKAGTNNSSLENHLMWVRRFYEGSVIYPIGWNDMSERVLESLPNGRERQELGTRLTNLGVAICIEWAQNNSIRKINSSNIAVWGSALRTAVQRNEQEAFIEMIEKDVSQLLSGVLDSTEIVQERYYPAQDYDNF